MDISKHHLLSIKHTAGLECRLFFPIPLNKKSKKLLVDLKSWRKVSSHSISMFWPGRQFDHFSVFFFFATTGAHFGFQCNLPVYDLAEDISICRRFEENHRYRVVVLPLAFTIATYQNWVAWERFRMALAPPFSSTLWMSSFRRLLQVPQIIKRNHVVVVC